MKIIIVGVLLLVVLFSLAMTMRDPLPGDRNPCSPTGYTWQEWEQKVRKEFWYYFSACWIALILLIWLL